MPTIEAAPTQGRSRWGIVILLVGAGVVSAFQAGKAPIALAAVQEDLGIGLALASWLLSAFAIVGAIAGIAIGVAVDHLGARRMAVAGLGIQAAASGVSAFADNPAVLLLARTVEGAGFVGVAVAAPTLILAVTAPSDRNRVFALWATFFPLGMTIVMLGAPLLNAIGWRNFWLANAALLLAYAALLAIGTRSISGLREGEPRSAAQDIARTLRVSGPWLLASLFAAYLAAYLAIFGFLPILLSERLAVGAETAAILSAVAVAAGVAGCLVGGELLNRGARSWLLMLATFGLMALCGFGILFDAVPGWIAFALAVLFSFVGAFIPTALFEAAPRHAPEPGLVGATNGFLIQGNNLGFVLGPAAAGLIAQSFGWPTVAWFVLVAALIAAVLCFALRRSAGEASVTAGPRP